MQMALYTIGLNIAALHGEDEHQLTKKSDFFVLPLNFAPRVNAITHMKNSSVDSSLKVPADNDELVGRRVLFFGGEESGESGRGLVKQHRSIDFGVLKIVSSEFSSLGLTAETAAYHCSPIRTVRR
ncbi:hypothetical protein IFT56_21900 [Rhizobium sp. CFBP 13717]|uniref:hypothetical protein n=2 Tax=unclassified Rhizobium TaxID=2613769 RepID=UPI00177EF864|nr:hypothetical protein [Rhizobium sp. CFBP 13717]MBD8689639.1 hypothetical protein [Rhizobium sp. CFBP 13644]MBD8694246.1 hypothetical protein [Rhizobium sp. CFBP 13717]